MEEVGFCKGQWEKNQLCHDKIHRATKMASERERVIGGVKERRGEGRKKKEVEREAHLTHLSEDAWKKVVMDTPVRRLQTTFHSKLITSLESRTGVRGIKGCDF